MKKLSLIIVIAALLMSCSHTFTPHQAANSGGKTCKDRHRIK